ETTGLDRVRRYRHAGRFGLRRRPRDRSQNTNEQRSADQLDLRADRHWPLRTRRAGPERFRRVVRTRSPRGGTVQPPWPGSASGKLAQRADELVFLFSFDPEWVARAPIRHVVYWHRRAFLLMAERAQIARNRREDLELEVGRAVKLLPGR